MSETSTKNDSKPSSTNNSSQHRIHAPDVAAAYPPFWRVMLITLWLCMSVFCMSLDNVIIATAIPKITDEFHSTDDVGWYGSAYLLTTCAFQLFFGKLYVFFPVKWIYLLSMLLFEIGSVVCGAAPNSTALIVGRAIAGVGAAGIFFGAFLVTAHTLPLEKRPLYLGFVGSMYGIASVAGPVIGGAFTDYVTWRWCFYINLPIGGATVACISLFFKSPVQQKRKKQTWSNLLAELDLVGLICFVPSVVCILLALQWGGTTRPWNDWRIILLLTLFGVLMVAFICIQVLSGEKATIPVRIAMKRNVASAVVFAGLLGSSFFSTIYFLPLWLQAVKGVDATQSGAAVTALGYANPFCIASTIFLSVGAGLLTTWHVDTAHSVWIGYQVIYGIGIGLGFQQPLVLVQTVLSLEDVPIGTALVIFGQTFGGAISLSVSENIFTNSLLRRLVVAAPDLDPQKILSAGVTMFRTVVSAEDLPAVLSAYNASITETFYIGLGTACATLVGALCLEWRSVKRASIGAA